jgi:DNA-binding response OmpR family regulator
MLEEVGYQVYAAADGEAGAELYRVHRESIDLVIIDMVMPRMNGRDTFYALKRINPDVRAVLSSGFVRDGGITDLMRDGLLGFVQKPYRHIELSKTIAKYLIPSAAPSDTEKSKQPSSQMSTRRPVSASRKLKALVVEDDTALLELLTETLMGRGCQVTSLINGSEGGIHIAENDYDLYLLDWDLPGLSGLGLCEAIREKRTGSESHIVMVSGKDTGSDLHKALACGANDYLMKPFSIEDLNTRLTVAEQQISRTRKRRKQLNALQEQKEELEKRLHSLSQENSCHEEAPS